MTRPATYTDRETGEEYTYADFTDTDTQEKGTTPPFETWEGDHTALVHVLWSLKHDGLIAGRPGRDQPLRQALFDRLHGPARSRGRQEDLIADLRAILDAHDPNITPGAPGARRLTTEEVAALGPESSPRQGGDAFDLAASVIERSRALAARTAHKVADALTDAADEEAEAQGSPMVSSVERLLRRAHEAVRGERPTDLPDDRSP